MNIGVFAYNFPHKKTQEGLIKLFIAGIDIKCVLAADKVKLNINNSEIRVAPKGITYEEPSVICDKLGISFHNVHHNSADAINLIKQYDLDIGIILGARILKKATIDAFNIGIINMHPGKLPENRGLDNLKWAILNNIDQGVTTHLISPEIDRGFLLNYSRVPVYLDDTLIDIHLRIQSTELNCMIEAIKFLASEEFKSSNQLTALGEGVYYKAVPPEIEKELFTKFNTYKLAQS